MPRPKLTCKVYRFDINMRLREGDDLIAFFQGIPPKVRVRAMKTALRSGKLEAWLDEDLSDDDQLADALDDLMF